MNTKRRKWIRAGVILLLTGIILFVFRIPIFGFVGRFLIQESPKIKGDVMVVLGGDSFDRSVYASELYREGLAKRIVCTGGNIPSVLAAVDTAMFEAEISRKILMDQQIPSSVIDTLCGSTSTWEESREILHYAQDHLVDTLIIVSSKFHLRRVRNVFENEFDETEITLNFQGAPSSRYKEDQWWKSEEGMIMVNNEYMKLLYYLFTY